MFSWRPFLSMYIRNQNQRLEIGFDNKKADVLFLKGTSAFFIAPRAHLRIHPHKNIGKSVWIPYNEYKIPVKEGMNPWRESQLQAPTENM